MVSEELILHIQKKANLAEVVSKYILLQQSRKALKGRCPFHNDETTSLMVMVDSNVFKCFGCGSEGGVVDFLSKIESRNRQEIAVRLAKELGLTISAN
jgi:DNA primase